MSLLQSPLRALDQIEWYLDNVEHEQFPGAFFLAAGNLCRQTLEQFLFILAFYGGLPTREWRGTKGNLKTAGQILRALRKIDPNSGRNYFHSARCRSPRIAKFARYPRSFDRWRDLFNEPSHFRIPAIRRRAREPDVRTFVDRARALLDDKDSHLIVGAVNEIHSNGKITAVIGENEDCTPGVSRRTIVEPRHLTLSTQGTLTLITPRSPVRVLPDDAEVPLRWPNAVILVQHSLGMALHAQLVTKWGQPVDISSVDTILSTFWRHPQGRRQLKRRMAQLGFTIEIEGT